MASVYATHCRAQTRLLRGALLQTVELMDEALCTHKPAGTYQVGAYNMKLEWTGPPTHICRITTSWGSGTHQEAMTLVSASRQEAL